MKTVKEIELYYDKDNVQVRDSSPTDIAYLRNELKHSDVEEIWASHHLLPYDALLQGFENSLECLTVTHDGRPLAMFGVVDAKDMPGSGIIWLLSTEELFKIRLEFLRHSSSFVNFMFHRHPEYKVLFNFVDARNVISVKWLGRIGARVADAVPFGIEKLPFHYFEFRRPENV